MVPALGCPASAAGLRSPIADCCSARYRPLARRVRSAAAATAVRRLRVASCDRRAHALTQGPPTTADTRTHALALALALAAIGPRPRVLVRLTPIVAGAADRQQPSAGAQIQSCDDANDGHFSDASSKA